MDTEKKYSVYGHVNITNGKWYVGMTSQEPKKRFNYGFGYQSNSKMWSDIKESDWNNDWIHTVFDTFDNREDALDYEAFLIDMFDTIENGYNTSSFDSMHYERTEEHKKNLSESLTGRTFTDEHKKKLSESMTGNYNSPTKPILQFSKKGEFISEYPSTHEAERQTGCNHQNLCECCKGTRKSAGGYIWKYKEG